ncbi:synaptotagmin-like protein 2 isoform X2 [Cynoglossus semilaevis]|uniref:synaptotagmin-like protein 2 isoform X2 n=1 Tax=Cynoglossus semilaevis TaxID=244447 RepID=UPI0007DCA211|nr:synaptotagmin-like protein 2 isoform X2 [Cynoglossus semilaevis]
MIDLSFLSEEEQEAILSVLKRDAELKKSEQQRVQKLQQTVSNKEQLKYLTGEWFYETKQLRHQDSIHGSDIIRASIKHTYKPMTILELSKILPEDSSFVCSENKEVFVPPLLCGLLQEVKGDRSPHVPPPDSPKQVVQSPTKRKNPFNTDFTADNEKQESHGEEDQTQEPREEPLPSFDRSLSHVENLRQDACLASQNAPESNAVSSNSQDSLVELNGSEVRQNNGVALRGILKQWSTSSSMDTSASDLDLDSPTEMWIDKKQVRFNSMVRQSTVERQNGRELGDHSLLDNNANAPPEMENNHLNNCDLENGGSAATGTRNTIPSQSGVGSQEEDGGCQNKARLVQREDGSNNGHGDVSEPSHLELLSPAGSTLTAEHEPGKLIQLKTESDKDCSSQANTTDEPVGLDDGVEVGSEVRPPTVISLDSLSLHALSPRLRKKLFGIFRRQKEKKPTVQKEEEKQKKPGQTQISNSDAADTNAAKPATVQHEANYHEKAEVRMLPLTALQKTTFIEAMEAGAQQEVTEDESQEEAKQEDISKKGREVPQGLQTNITSVDNKTTITTTLSSQTVCDSSSKDGDTYRANPVLIYEEADDLLTVLESKETIITHVSSSVPVSDQEHQDAASSSILQQSCSSPSEDRPANISELKHFWESENSSSRIPTVRKKETSSTLSPGKKAISSRSDVKTSCDNRKMVDKSAVSTSMRVSGKGFVTQSPKRSRSTSSPVSRIKAEKVSKAKSPSPSKFRVPKLKDQDDEVRKSPSKTCHPRVLPRESSSPKPSKLEGSPLKTFPIDIDPQQQVRSTPTMEGQGRSPTHGAKQTKTKCSPDFTPHPPHLHPEVRGHHFHNVKKLQSNASPSSSPKPKAASVKKAGSLTSLARSFITQDYQHFLGPQETAFAPAFHQEKFESHRLQNDVRDCVENLSDSPTMSNQPRRTTSWVAHKNDGNSSQETTTRTWLLSWASSGSHDDSPTSIVSALRRLSSRMSTSKSLEDLSSQQSEESRRQDSRGQINLSVDDVSSLSPSASFSKQLKTSVSVPVLQDEVDSDSPSETTIECRRNTGSSTSNISLSSGMASMSSVSGSMSSIYPTDYGDIEVQGNIQFAMSYIQKLGEFHIFVVHCQDLAVGDTKKSRTDPYVKCYLLPEKTDLGKKKTTVKKKTFNPEYNEVLRFKVNKEVLKTQNLNVSVWHNDTFGRNSFLGEVELDLSEWDFNNTRINEYMLKSRVSALTPAGSPSRLRNSRGRMRVALRFLPQTSHSKSITRTETGEVQIWVKDCKDLPAARGVVINAFVKCTVLPDTSKKSRQKTRVVKRTANPMFNHTMVYDGFRSEDLREACVEITVWDHDRLNSQFIGGLRLGLGTGKSYGLNAIWMDSTAAEANLWQRMLESDGEWVEDLLPLRMFGIAKCI